MQTAAVRNGRDAELARGRNDRLKAVATHMGINPYNFKAGITHPVYNYRNVLGGIIPATIIANYGQGEMVGFDFAATTPLGGASTAPHLFSQGLLMPLR